MHPHFGFEAGEALQEPVGANEAVDEGAFHPRGGHAILVIAIGHGLELGGIFARNDLRFAIDAGFERVEARDRLALRSARARRELRISTIRLKLA